MDDPYLIWSHEHSAWWKPGARGYTNSPALAGRFNPDVALAICINAIPGTAQRLRALPKLPVRLADLLTILQNSDHPF